MEAIKISDYKGSIVIPSTFPYIYHLWNVVEYPEAVCDGYAIDFHAFKSDIEKAVKSSKFTKHVIDQWISNAEQGKPLSEPKYIIDRLEFMYFILFRLSEDSTKHIPVAIQVKYYNYFKIKYPELILKQYQFCGIVGMEQKGCVVGLVMPILYTQDVEYYD